MMLIALLTLGVGDMEFLHSLAHEVVDSARVPQNAAIEGVGSNETGYTLRVPGGTQNYYPAFWIRDAAMMLGADLVPAEEVEGWIRLVASTQPGPRGLRFPHGLRVPAYSVPDHITLRGEACWYPGAYAEQGTGAFGILPPADDAFYFIQMVHERYRLTRDVVFLRGKLKTGWGEQPLMDVCERAFGSVATDPVTGLVVCDGVRTRVDWGFCDTVRKTGLALMPSLLRWQAAIRMVEMSRATGDAAVERRYRAIGDNVKRSIGQVFYEKNMLLSATCIGRQPDVWASAFAAHLGLLTSKQARAVSRRLVELFRAGRLSAEGQVRHLPTGEYWEKALCARDEYQNGGYWATPTGWLITAIAMTDQGAARELFSQYMAHLRAERTLGAPFEWTNPMSGRRVNANYASSVGLVYVALTKLILQSAGGGRVQE